MKKINVKKLQLNKSTVTTLTLKAISRVRGGGPITAPYSHQIDCPVGGFTERVNCVQGNTYEPGCVPIDGSRLLSCFDSCYISDLSCPCANSFQVPDGASC
jgi:hypothetical protein